jgi:O-antigen ligase
MWLWKAMSVRKVLGIPVVALAPLLLATAVLCKSTGASALMAIGLMVLFGTTLLKTRWAVRLLIAIPVMYILTRTVGGWNGSELVEAAQLVSDERGGSLNFRLNSENDCWELIQPHVLFGFGRFVFAGMRGTSSTSITPDGLWLIALVSNGLFGLAMLFGSMLLPVLAFARKIKPIHWTHPAVAPAGVLAVIVVLYAIDSLFNAMINPIFILISGALVSTAASIPNVRRKPAPAYIPARTRPSQPAAFHS